MSPSAAVARTRDGTSLSYTLRGDGTRSAARVALVHSLGLSRFVWDAVAERLAERAQVLTYDCRGHGASSKPAGPYELETFANDLQALLDAVGWEDAHVAGCSMGGNVALCLAVTAPHRVRTLGLIDTTAWYGEQAQESWDERAERARKQGLGSMVDFQETRWFSQAFRAAQPDVVARAREIFLANDAEAYAATCRMLGRFDLRPRLSTCGMPTAIAVGEEDYATPLAMAEHLHGAIAGSTLDVLPRARHLTTLEEPARIAEILTGLHARAAT